MLTAVAFIIMQFQERNLGEQSIARKLDFQQQQQLQVERSMQQQFDNIQKTNQILDIQTKQTQLVVELQKQVGELEKRIDELQNRLKEIEKRSPNKKNIQFRLIENNTPTLVPPQPQPQLPSDAKKSDVRKSEVVREYIVPAIYVVLAVILMASALVTLATSDRNRKDTALEITKTLMTFFIGAATGQA
jgi:allophanate hydrolase subunit 1